MPSTSLVSSALWWSTSTQLTATTLGLSDNYVFGIRCTSIVLVDKESVATGALFLGCSRASMSKNIKEDECKASADLVGDHHVQEKRDMEE